jgi:hypothetical protein
LANAITLQDPIEQVAGEEKKKSVHKVDSPISENERKYRNLGYREFDVMSRSFASLGHCEGEDEGVVYEEAFPCNGQV